MKRLLIIFLFTVAASAQAKVHDGALTLSPAVITLRGASGQSTTQVVRLTNGTSQDFAFDVTAEDVIVRDGKRVMSKAGQIAGSIATTAAFSQRSGVVHAGDTMAMTVTLTLPPSTDCRAVVVLFRGTRKLMNGPLPVLANIGTLLTFAISDDVSLDAGAVAVTPPSSSANASISNVCINNGREPVVARGVVAILDSRGTLVGRAPIEPRRLLPSERAVIRAEYPSDLAPGRYAVLLTLGYEGKTVVQRGDLVVP